MDAPRPPRRPTWRPKGPPGGRLGRQRAAQDANLEPKWIEKRSQREPRGSKNEAREPTLANKAEMQKTMKNLIKIKVFLRILGVWTPSKTKPEAIKIRVWRLRGAKSGPSWAPVPKKSKKKLKNRENPAAWESKKLRVSRGKVCSEG